MWKAGKRSSRAEQCKNEEEGVQIGISRKYFLPFFPCCTHWDDEKQREERTSITSRGVCSKEEESRERSGRCESSSREINGHQLFWSLSCSGYDTDQIKYPVTVRQNVPALMGVLWKTVFGHLIVGCVFLGKWPPRELVWLRVQDCFLQLSLFINMRTLWR